MLGPFPSNAHGAKEIPEGPRLEACCLYLRCAFGWLSVLLYILLLSQVTVVKLKRTKLLRGNKSLNPDVLLGNNWNFLFPSSGGRRTALF